MYPEVFQNVEFISPDWQTCMFCPAHNLKDGILKMVGSDEANMVMGIKQCNFSDGHPEPQSQIRGGLQDRPMPQNLTFQKPNSSLPPCMFVLLAMFCVLFDDFRNSWAQHFLWASYPSYRPFSPLVSRRFCVPLWRLKHVPWPLRIMSWL